MPSKANYTEQEITSLHEPYLVQSKFLWPLCTPGANRSHIHLHSDIFPAFNFRGKSPTVLFPLFAITRGSIQESQVKLSFTSKELKFQDFFICHELWDFGFCFYKSVHAASTAGTHPLSVTHHLFSMSTNQHCCKLHLARNFSLFIVSASADLELVCVWVLPMQQKIML